MSPVSVLRSSKSPSKLVRKRAWTTGSMRVPARRSMRHDRSVIEGIASRSTTAMNRWSGPNVTHGVGGAVTLSTTSCRGQAVALLGRAG